MRAGAAAITLLIVTASLARGQGGFGRIEGTVVDSLNGGFLRGATVGVTGTQRIAFTDSLGRFRIDSVYAGEHRLELFHEVLDTLALRVYTAQTVVPRDSLIIVELAVPSARTIIRAKCADDRPEAAAIFGMVADPESDEPVAGAQVTLEWTELIVGRERGIRYQPRSIMAETDASGRYKLCGLLAGMSGDLSVARGDQRMAIIPVELTRSPVRTASVFLARSLADGHAAVRGTVSDSAGVPLAGARVALASGSETAVTDSSGRFSLASRRSGTHALVVRRLGFQPAEEIVHLSSRAERRVHVRLKLLVPVLEAVVVEARRAFALESVGFSRRKRAGLGRYLSREDLDRRSAFNVSDYLRMIPEVNRPSGLGSTICVRYYVDGVEWRDAEPDEFIAPGEIGAMEVYSGAFVPSEFQGFEPCAVVVIWTKAKLGMRR